MRPCTAPSALPATGLDARGILRFWGRDRVSLAACADRQAALSAYGRAMDAAVGGE